MPLKLLRPYGGAVYAVLLGLSALWGLFWSWDWLMYADAPMFHYIAWRILEGAAPYRDMVEADMPGTLLLHLLCLKVFGGSDLGFRLFDLWFLLMGSASIALYAWRYSRGYALVGGLLFACYHLSWGAISMGERDFLLVPLLVLCAYWLRAFIEATDKAKPLLWFGLAAGYGVCIKPLVGVFVLLSLALAVWHARSMRGRLMALLHMGAGGMVVLAGVLGWLYATGGLAAFYDVLLRLLPFYSTNQPLSFEYRVTFLLVHAYCFAMAAFILWRRSFAPTSERWVLAIGLLYGFAHFTIQDRGLWYHLYPLRAFWCVYVAVVFAQLRGRWLELACIHALMLAIVLHFSPLDALSRRQLARYQHDFSQSYMDRAANDAHAALARVPAAIREPYLQQRPQGWVMFFSLGTRELWNVAFRQRWVTPTRHIYPFPIYGADINPSLKPMHDELLADIASVLPPVVMLSSESWPKDEGFVYGYVDENEPWKTLFARHYRVHVHNDYYRVYYRVK